MRKQKRKPDKKYFTAEQANQMLPLVRAIVQDIVDLAQHLQQKQELLVRMRPTTKGAANPYYDEELLPLQQEMSEGAARMEELVDELRRLGIELKSWDGLIDFPCWTDGREVLLCWKLGEPDVSYWHEIDAGFAGRQLLADTAISSQKV